MDPRELFDTNLPTINRVIGRVCAKAGLSGADAEDFASEARLALLSDDCAILREWEGRAALGTYLTVVVQRVFADARRQITGKWRPSAEACRIGETAIALERMLRRDGRSLDEALPALRAIDPSLSREDARAIAERLPERMPRPRLVALDPELEIESARDRADARADASEAARLAERTSTVMQKTIEAMPLEDRLILRFRFAQAMTIANIARMLRLPQRPLYRRIESIVARLRQALRDANLPPEAIEGLIGSPLQALDFGLWKNGTTVPAIEKEGAEDAQLDRSGEEGP